MIIEEIMTRDVVTIRPEQSLLDAAELMRSLDVGSLPVQESDRLIGMITDRDIVVRGLTDNDVAGKTVRDVMSEEVMYCRAGDQVESVATNMADLEMRRLPVVDDNNTGRHRVAGQHDAFQAFCRADDGARRRDAALRSRD